MECGRHVDPDVCIEIHDLKTESTGISTVPTGPAQNFVCHQKLWCLCAVIARLWLYTRNILYLLNATFLTSALFWFWSTPFLNQLFYLTEQIPDRLDDAAHIVFFYLRFFIMWFFAPLPIVLLKWKLHFCEYCEWWIRLYFFLLHIFTKEANNSGDLLQLLKCNLFLLWQNRFCIIITNVESSCAA